MREGRLHAQPPATRIGVPVRFLELAIYFLPDHVRRTRSIAVRFVQHFLPSSELCPFARLTEASAWKCRSHGWEIKSLDKLSTAYYWWARQRVI